MTYGCCLIKKDTNNIQERDLSIDTSVPTELVETGFLAWGCVCDMEALQTHSSSSPYGLAIFSQAGLKLTSSFPLQPPE